MTPPARRPNAVSVALSLALGREVESPSRADWRGAYAVARAERLFALAWLRSGQQIRQHAPPDVAGAWRSDYVAVSAFADRQAAALRDIARQCEQIGERPLVLKGLPLAESLYGDRAARVCGDIDLLVSHVGRAALHAALSQLGWIRWYDAAPYDSSYRLMVDNTPLFLEVHSMLVGEALAHCSLTTDREALWSCEGMALRTLDGPAMPVYLAANIAKHGTPSLLSYLDLAIVWQRLSDSDREEAHRIAVEARLARCLRWALAGADAVAAAARGDATGFETLGVEGDRRRSVHAFLRLIWLADRPDDVVRILAAWAWPRSVRHHRDGAAAFWGRRLRRSFAGRFRYTREYATDAAPGR